MNPETAIVVPTYNAEATIRETLESIQAQEPGLGQVAEVLISDDGSTDDTARVARACWRSTTPLRILERKGNVGQWPNLNGAIDELFSSNIRWFFILHADDIAKPHWLSQMLSIIETSEATVASVTASYDVLYPDGRTEVGEDATDARRLVKGTTEAIVNTIERGCWWKISSCSIRLAAFRGIGSFRADYPYMSDLEWVLRLLGKGWAIEYVPKSLSIYRQASSGVSSQSFRLHQDIREWLAILDEFSGYLSREQRCQKLAWLRRSLVRRIAASLLRGEWERARDAKALLGKVAVARRNG